MGSAPEMGGTCQVSSSDSPRAVGHRAGSLSLQRAFKPRGRAARLYARLETVPAPLSLTCAFTPFAPVALGRKRLRKRSPDPCDAPTGRVQCVPVPRGSVCRSVQTFTQ